MSERTLDKLVYMANQIAREFAGQRPRDAADATWDHLWHFWDPRMRSMIVAHLAAGRRGAERYRQGGGGEACRTGRARAANPCHRVQPSRRRRIRGDVGRWLEALPLRGEVGVR